jgi:[ribosomal protein S18]-alanine N-acetyltransferase
MSAVVSERPRFEPMSERDLGAVMEIERRIYEFPWTRGNFIDSMRAGYDCWVYRGAGALIGYAIIAAAVGEAHLLNLSISDRFQGRGHGGLFLTHLIGATRESGAVNMFLEVRPTNEIGRRLYARHGFKRVGIRRNYYPAGTGREDAWVLSRLL